ncbi:beta-defensin 125 [Panthera uncia]|uniref:beta-defensin 125 n=1 Tax=Panthera uncia TaxID=29064 RepID=UPI0020FF966D|nr:beta-defensin 125 [Panthera uncia]
MNLLMLAFIICGFLNLVTKAGWEVKRCWKDNIGHCRKRCFHVERYKLLCMNKLTCCIPIKEDDGYTKTPPRPVPFEERITVNTNEWDLFSNSPISWFDDEIPEGGTAAPVCGFSLPKDLGRNCCGSHEPHKDLAVGGRKGGCGLSTGCTRVQADQESLQWDTPRGL